MDNNDPRADSAHSSRHSTAPSAGSRVVCVHVKFMCEQRRPDRPTVSVDAGIFTWLWKAAFASGSQDGAVLHQNAHHKRSVHPGKPTCLTHHLWANPTAAVTYCCPPLKCSLRTELHPTAYKDLFAQLQRFLCMHVHHVPPEIVRLVHLVHPALALVVDVRRMH